MKTEKTEEIAEKREPNHFVDFLETTPPNQLIELDDLFSEEYHHNLRGHYPTLLFPEIQLHCPSEQCNGTRFFRCIERNRPTAKEDSYTFEYITYICSNCQEHRKTYALGFKAFPDNKSGECYKFGELPTYGPPMPSKLMKLIGPDRDEFLKGRRCENQGLGVGAFIYYRRVVESQKNRILSEIVKVLNKIGGKEEQITVLEASIKETQFSKALKNAKDAIPESLLINGHNPLLLLHGALSDGVHDRTDEHCLEIAGSVRIVLSELSERLSQALKDEAELSKALSKLLNKKEPTSR